MGFACRPKGRLWYGVGMRKPASASTSAHDGPASAGFVLGRERFARISAVEGVAFTPSMRADLERFDRDNLSAADRRRVILARFTPAR
jgi:hypothetical protein